MYVVDKKAFTKGWEHKGGSVKSHYIPPTIVNLLQEPKEQ